jgi:phosphate-selective porin OprO/OprP
MKSIKMRGVVAAVSGALMFGFGANAMADSTTDIVNALVAKGVLTEEEGALLTKGREGEVAGSAKKPKLVEKNGNFSLESADGKNSVALTGRVHFDMRSNNVGGEPTDNGFNANFAGNGNTSRMADQFELRRARVGVKGKVFGDFDYEVVTNVVGSSSNLVDVAYLNAGTFQQAQLKLGQFKQPFNLEEYGTSSNNIDFMERSYMNQISPGKKVGAMLHGVPTNGVTYAGSVYQQNNFGETDAGTDGKGLAGRLTANIAELAGWKNSVLHIGVAGFDSEYGVVPTNTANTAKTPEQNTRGSLFVITDEARGFGTVYRAQIAGDAVGATSGVAGSYGYGTRSATSAKVNNKAYGLELAGTYGPVKVQGEYMNSQFDANHDDTGNKVGANVEAFYVEALWMLTGENYSDWYKNGAWSAIKAKNNFDLATKGWGAWELGLRYDEFSVSDTTVTYGSVQNGYTFAGNSNRFQGAVSDQKKDGNTGYAGSQGGAKSYTAGLKWIVNPDVRVMLNYTHTKFDYAFSAIDVTNAATGATGQSDHVDTVMLRTQVAF